MRPKKTEFITKALLLRIMSYVNLCSHLLGLVDSGLGVLHKTELFCITGQSIPIPHSEPFSHLRCGNG